MKLAIFDDDEVILFISYLIHKQSLPTRSIQLADFYLPTNHTCKKEQ